MKTKTLVKHLVAVAVLTLAIGQAQAATTFDLSLTGIVSGGVYSSGDYGSTHYEDWYLQLSGLLPITVSQGDTINATITLDKSFTIPASVQLTFFDFTLSGTSFPSINTGTSGTTSFFNNGAPGLSGSFGTTTSGFLINGAVFGPPNNTSITFDSLTSNFTIDTLGQSVILDGAYIDYILESPATSVPIPAAIWLLGSGLLGLAGFRRKIKQ
jgi:hypothetical protein